MTNRLLLLVAAACVAAGCRGQVSDQPPIHIVPDMDHQPKYHADGESAFFADGRANRPYVEGTVARRDASLDDSGFREGKDASGQFLAKAPVEVDEALLRRGQQRFGIYCMPCHDAAGSGAGIVVARGFPAPINLASEHTRGLPDGELYDIITNGVRNMPSYGPQIAPHDRWAVVAWLRVLQRSQNASVEDVPENLRNKIEAETAP